mmetsp:Transcript_133054/g.332099  ORF Transcript_133054/g.332099 Transcript_133054/m.332099 type:complete len:280 (-) Transcript_133054:594-1433(-)
MSQQQRHRCLFHPHPNFLEGADLIASITNHRKLQKKRLRYAFCLSRPNNDRSPQLAPVRDSLDIDLVLREHQVKEAILVIIPIRARYSLTGNAATTTRDNERCWCQKVTFSVGVPDLLVVPMPCDDQVNTVLLHEVLPTFPSRIWWDVGHDDLPLGLCLRQVVLYPISLLRPQPRKPKWALIQAVRALGAAIGIRKVVLPPTNVVSHEHVWCPGSEDIGIKKIVIDREVGVPHPGLPILSWSHPAVRAAVLVASPSVTDNLVPAGSEHVTAVVVVAQYA